MLSVLLQVQFVFVLSIFLIIFIIVTLQLFFVELVHICTLLLCEMKFPDVRTRRSEHVRLSHSNN